MKTSQRGIDLIKKYEGLMTRAYPDPAGVWTIGYGHTAKAGPPIPVPGMTIRPDRAEALLRADLVQYEKAVSAAVQVPLSQNQFDALVSFTFNVGPHNLRQSTLLTLLNEGKYGAVPGQLKRWDKATIKGAKVTLRGLTKRRAAEAALWSLADDAPPPPDIEMTEDQLPKGWAVKLWKKVFG